MLSFVREKCGRQVTIAIWLGVFLMGCSGSEVPPEEESGGTSSGGGEGTLDVTFGGSDVADGGVDGVGTDGEGGEDAADMGMDLGDDVSEGGDTGDETGECSDGDNDLVCDEDDQCPGSDDLADEDDDTVPDGCDVCPDGDDTEDADNDDIPDACDCGEADNCHEDAFCTPEDDGTITCECNPGYTGDGIDTCDNINECPDDPCADNAACADTLGGFTCACSLGYAGDPYDAGCDDINECETENGGCAQTCNNQQPDFICSCEGGYVLAANGLDCDNVNECETGNGGCAHNCVDNAGSFTCNCDAGYQLAGNGLGCDNVNECANANGGCDHDCEDSTGSFSCSCDSGYTLDDDGATCNDILECATNNGDCAQICNEEAGSYSCACNDGYELAGNGLDCNDISECGTGNGGCAQICTEKDGGFECSCNDGYELAANGTDCDDILECASNNGGCDQICNEEAGGFSCACNSGWSLDDDEKSCVDVNECASGNGGCDQICNDADGSFSCDCNDGWTLDDDGRSCVDINECGSDNGGCDQICNDADGGFSCDCNDGWTLDDDGKSCVDVNECASDNGGCDQICNDADGSFSCDCNDGWTLDDDGTSCVDVKECASENGGCEGTCHEEEGGYSCSCSDGYQLDENGLTCSDIDECEAGGHDCDDVAGCSDGLSPAGGWTCGSCPDGYGGGGTTEDPCLPRVTVVFKGKGGGEFFTDMEVLNCSYLEEDCSALLAPGTSFRFGAEPIVGSSLTGLTVSDCEDCERSMTMGTSPVTITVEFDLSANLVFVADVDIQPSTLGLEGSMQDAADALCQQAAEDAVLPGNYVAWLSTTGIDGVSAPDRLAGASGWVGLDGEVFATDLDSLLEVGAVYTPIRFTTTGGAPNYVFTGTKSSGEAGSTCGNGTSNSGSPTVGDPTAGTTWWTQYGGGGTTGCNGTYDLYCFGVDVSDTLSPPSNSGLTVFVTDSGWTPGGGPADADAFCQENATSLPGTYRALLTVDGFSAAERLTGTDAAGEPDYSNLEAFAESRGRPQQWVRPDGTTVVGGIEGLFASDLQATVGVTPNLDYLGGYGIWTGLPEGVNFNKPLDESENCKNWADTSSTGSAGTPAATGSQFANQWDGNACTAGHIRLACVEVRPNEVYNGDFNYESLDGWQTEGQSTLGSLDRHGLTTSQSLMSISSGSVDNTYCLQVPSGATNYRLEAWQYTDTTSALTGVFPGFYEGDDCATGTIVGHGSQIFETPGEWQRVLHQNTLPNGTASMSIVLRHNSAASATTVWWDNISVDFY